MQNPETSSMDDPTPLAGERHGLIEARLRSEGRIVAQDLAAELGVSEDTIRRDLRAMAKAGILRRVYGGALPLAPSGGAMPERTAANRDAKAALAQVAVGLLVPGQVWFLDAGSTNLAIAATLPRDARLTVVTNAQAIALTLADHPNVEVIQIGGTLHKQAGACLGARALRDAAQVHADICFLGACGVDAEAGISAFYFEDAEFKRAIAQASRRVVIAVTSDKLGTAAPYHVLPLDAVDTLILESHSNPPAGLARAGLTLLKAAPERA